MHGGDLVAEVLSAHGVPFLFALCGGHIAPILIGSKKKKIQVVDVRDEATAVFAADAVARLTGIPGVAAVTAGPGLTNTITALKNAQMAESPLILLGGATATLLKGRGSLQDIDQMALIKPHVKWMKALRQVREIVPTLEEAFSQACSGLPGPVFIEFPIDLLYEEKLVKEWYGAKSDKRANSLGDAVFQWYLTRHVNKLFADVPSDVKVQKQAIFQPHPSAHQTEQIQERLAQSEQPLLVVGSQALGHPGEASHLIKALEHLSIPTYLSGMARGLLEKDHPLQKRHKRREALKEADLVILAGVPCDFRLDYGRHIGKKASVVIVNLAYEELRKNRDLVRSKKPRFEVKGEPGEFLIQLSHAWKAGKKWMEWKEILQKRDEEREVQIQKEMEEKTNQYMNPLRVCQEIEKSLGEKSLIVADGGDFVATASYILKPRSPLSWLDPGVFGTLGVGAGFALGAKLSHPEKEVWILYGDGSAGYSLMEFDTFVRFQIPVIAVVGNDACWSQIAREQSEIFHDEVGTVLRRTDYHKVAEGWGGKGILVEKEEDLGSAFQKAKELASQGHPVLVNCLLGKTDFRKGSISM